jgi:hypothetical protein
VEFLELLPRLNARLLVAARMAVAWNTLLATCNNLLVGSSAFELRGCLGKAVSSEARYRDLPQPNFTELACCVAEPPSVSKALP